MMHGMEITWLTQASFAFDCKGKRVVVDPYLSNIATANHGMTRIAEFPLSMDELKPDFIFCTHDHVDHLDPEGLPQIAEAYPDCVFIGPQSVVAHYRKLGIEPSRIQELIAGESRSLGPFTLTATQAVHSDYYAVGLIVQTLENCVYLSGDTLSFKTLGEHVKQLAQTELDIVLICINGRLGNMTLDEAVNMVGELQPRLAIPMHYGLFAENTVDPQPFVEKCKALGVAAQTLTPGASLRLNPRPGEVESKIKHEGSKDTKLRVL